MDKFITLIGIKLAKKNRKFLFMGAVKECETCDPSLKSVCIDNLEKGCVYEILDIRKIVHPCPLYEEGVIVIEVQKAPITAAIDAKLVYEGATISFIFPDCNESSCLNYKYCKPLGMNQEGKFKIIKVFGNILYDCKFGRKLKLVEMKQ